MKKIVVTMVIVLQTTFLFGQQWSNWVKATCNQGIQGAAVNYGYNEYGKGYEWNWKVKNTYTRTVTFDLYFKVGNDKKSWGTFTLEPNREHQHVSFYYNDASPAFLITVENVFFGTLQDPSSERCWAECDNGTAICNVKGAQANSSSGNNQQTTKQNDLTEYNRSKADLERQMQNENAKRQEEANRINNQSKQFVNVYNEGVDLQRRGNFKEAKDKYQQASGLATNDTQRKQAKNAFDDMDKATRNEAALNVIGDGLKQIGSALDKAHEEKQQKYRDERSEHERKRAIIDEDKAINTLIDPKIFETYADYVVKNLESLNYTFEKISLYTNIPNKEKTVMLNFKGIMVIITNLWDGSSMSKYITFKAESEKLYSNLKNSAFLETLKQLYPFYDNFSEKLNSFDHTNCIVFGLEKTQPFIEIYNKGYQSTTYKGFAKTLSEFEKATKQKLAKADNSVDGLIEKAQIYRFGNNGVEKNYQKALELYQQAFDKSKDKEILLKIGNLHEENLKFDKAIESYESYIANNDNIKFTVYSSLGWIYKNVGTPFYNVEKAKNNFEKEIAILETNYNRETVENKKIELKKNIANTYSTLGFLYNYGKNVVPEVSVVYYEKALQWNENDTRAAFDLMSLYAKDWKDGNFKRDTKKAKFWALKVCEIADRLEAKSGESFETKMARMSCGTAKDHLKNNFKYLKK